MLPPSTLCRLQQAYHQERASVATLENVRVISAKAASAWAREAVLAEMRETRQERRRTTADANELNTPLSPEFDDRSFSENPDRGFASQ
jgi:hypothetical protein